MNYVCPRCRGKHFYKNGSYWRKSDGKSIQRLICYSCGKKFSYATFNRCYRQKKRKVNSILKGLLCSGVSQRRCALLLNINRKTVVRKFLFLAKQALLKQDELLTSLPKIKHIQLDDLITSEHSKCKPLSVSVAIDRDSHKILGIEVSSIPAFGHLASIARKKYGFRADQREEGLDQLFEKISPYLDTHVRIDSDQHKLYPPIIKKYLPYSNHQTYQGRKACVAGQGELKKGGYDPLFMINHTLAMMRANINRLFRRTWCTTKQAKYLTAHLNLYREFHNTVLV